MEERGGVVGLEVVDWKVRYLYEIVCYNFLMSRIPFKAQVSLDHRFVAWKSIPVNARRF